MAAESTLRAEALRAAMALAAALREVLRSGLAAPVRLEAPALLPVPGLFDWLVEPGLLPFVGFLEFFGKLEY